ncbi:bifunctional fructose-bisphosphatase/inositol-phosphate phosphatase [Brevibacterium daeguense]|uniref:Bifunctional fructose-bisphosphatase/inositol-phosphate phosphatase n=1 Tax=Brevibacterium daeguense TaxID=909936 RepID=A0ABP8EGL6_9MICO|nr:inositol monophosphatase family protein [Brevibacterium daeguense]
MSAAGQVSAVTERHRGNDLVPYRAPRPVMDPEVSPVLAALAHAAVAGVNEAWENHGRRELVEEVKMGADGTATYRIDAIVEDRIAQAATDHHVNLLSEEIGFLDGGHAATLVVDPLDGSANAAAGVPLSCFSAALFVDGEPREALNVWLENGHSVWARADTPVPYRTSGTSSLTSAAVGLLRPKVHSGGDSTAAWLRVSAVTSRVRILSSSCLEAMLVAEGSIDAFADPGSQTHRLMDLAAALLFVPAAGGAVIDAFGQQIEFDTDLTRRWSGVIAATPELAEEMAQVIVGE